MEPNVREAAELLLGKKLEDFCDALESPAGESDDTVDRGARWSASQECLRAHSRRALKDYIALIALFGALAPGEEIEELYDAHADRLGESLLDRLGSVARADRNRASNLVASVKAEAREILREEVSRWIRARSAASNEMAKSEELDDRLPLARRGVFDRDLVELVEDARRENQALSLVMMDIDHFKKINDAHGHPVGDEVLVEVASLVVKRLAHKGRAYRYGGEEIALLLPTYSSEEAFGLAERIRKDLEGRTLSSRNLRVTASFGVASVPDQAPDAKSLLERADAALYESKQGGRNRVRAAGRDQ
jgi:diguanylate cyclase (GGDEF)-like protein